MAVLRVRLQAAEWQVTELTGLEKGRAQGYLGKAREVSRGNNGGGDVHCVAAGDER